MLNNHLAKFDIVVTPLKNLLEEYEFLLGDSKKTLALFCEERLARKTNKILKINKLSIKNTKNTADFRSTNEPNTIHPTQALWPKHTLSISMEYIMEKSYVSKVKTTPNKHGLPTTTLSKKIVLLGRLTI